MKCPDKVQLSRADGEALRTRLAGDALTTDDRRVLDQVLQWYFWLVFAFQEAKISLSRFRTLLFGKPSTAPTAPASETLPVVGAGDEGGSAEPAEGTEAAKPER